MKLLLLLGVSLSSFAQQSAPSALPESARSARVDALIESSILPVAPGGSLVIEPGIRAIKVGTGYSLATYDGSRIDIVTSDGRMALVSPANAWLNDREWVFGNGKASFDRVITARRLVQDDTDSNLKSMQDSAKKLKAKSIENQGDKPIAKKLRVRWLFGENPMPTAELFNSAAIQQLTHLSNIGF